MIVWDFVGALRPCNFLGGERPVGATTGWGSGEDSTEGEGISGTDSNEDTDGWWRRWRDVSPCPCPAQSASDAATAMARRRLRVAADVGGRWCTRRKSRMGGVERLNRVALSHRWDVSQTKDGGADGDGVGSVGGEAGGLARTGGCRWGTSEREDGGGMGDGTDGMGVGGGTSGTGSGKGVGSGSSRWDWWRWESTWTVVSGVRVSSGLKAKIS